MADGHYALVGKMPETTIKALFRGAQCALLLSIVQVEQLGILCLELRVEDEPEHPFSVATPDILPEGLVPLRPILSSKRTTLHCINELDHPTLSAWADLESSAARKALNELDSLDPAVLSQAAKAPLQIADQERIANLALDQFQRHIYRPITEEIHENILMTRTIGLELQPWPPIELVEVRPAEQVGPFRIDDVYEGHKQERSLHLMMGSIYPGRTYRAPEIEDKGKPRELTDIIAFDNSSLCLIESKATGVLSANFPPKAGRRRDSTTGDISQALGQLRGALKRVRVGKEIFDERGEVIVFPNHETSLAHAIVVLSEMYAFLDWQEIARWIVEYGEDDARRALYHVIDVQELGCIVAITQNPDAFSQLMIQRWATVRERGTAYVRTKFSRS